VIRVAVPDQKWARTAPARAVRELVLRGVFDPLIAGHAHVTVSGRGALEAIDGPAVLVANHSSHVDTPILLGALTAARRRMTLVGAAADYFYTRRDLAIAVSLAFGTVPIERRFNGEPSAALDALEQLIADGFSLILYAEGTRSRTGRLGEFRPGAAALARRRSVPLVPVRISGTAQLMAPGRGWMARADRSDRRVRHPVSVEFGAALRPAAREEVRPVMDEVRHFISATA
jgi:1-acyl-sn-glycerol-3-phosphate acyltransferase